LKAFYLFAAGVGLAVSACSPAAEEADASATEGATEAAAAAVPATPEEFVNQIASNDLFEVEAAKLAQENATSDEVKEFAELMVKDHAALIEKLEQAAGEAQPGLKVAPELSKDQQWNLGRLQDAGASFDMAFARQQVNAQESALAALRDYANSGDNPALRAFATEAAGMVEGHLEKARALL